MRRLICAWSSTKVVLLRGGQKRTRPSPPKSVRGSRCLRRLAVLLYGFANLIGLQAALSTPAHGQTVAPCPQNIYGTQAQATAIENAMYNGTAANVRAAIDAAKATRGDEVGCPQTSYPSGNFPSQTEPSLATVASNWTTIHQAGLNNSYPAGSTYNCPRIGRMEPSAALGAYHARLAGYSTDATSTANLRNIADKLVATQSTTANYSGSLPAGVARGFYASVNASTGDVCRLPGVAGNSVQSVCANATLSVLCKTYSGGLWQGRQFLIADQYGATWKDGGGAYDAGFAGVMMIEAYLANKSNSTLSSRYFNSANALAQWADAEYPVRNHNYTAKLIWFMAQMYGLTGNAAYRTDLLDKIERNLKPGVLVDTNANGQVDGMAGQPFSGLVDVAQRPGRNWDGHNALPWYGAMNAWAAVEAYVALRDRGNTTEANALKPYANAMLDNLAWEVVNKGTAAGAMTTPELNMTQMLYALTLGLWKIAAYENVQKPNWRSAAAMLYNRGMVANYGAFNTLVAGTYLTYRSGTAYVPLAQR